MKAGLILRARSGWQAIDLQELWEFRGLLAALATRDVKIRYKQTVLGVLWVVLQPLLAAGVFSFVFGKVAKLSSGRVPYFLFAYAGLLGWNLFSGTLNKVSGSLVGNASLVTKIYFPRLLLPLSAVAPGLLDCGVALLMLVFLMRGEGVAPGWGALLLPIWLGLLVMLALGIGLITAALTVRYRDVGVLQPVVLQLLLYASPIAYSVSAVPAALSRLYWLNPLCGLLEAVRWSLLSSGELHGDRVLYSGLFGLGVLCAGALFFRRAERSFADVI